MNTHTQSSYKWVFLALSLSLCGHAVYAEDAVTLPTLVVTATRNE